MHPGATLVPGIWDRHDACTEYLHCSDCNKDSVALEEWLELPFPVWDSGTTLSLARQFAPVQWPIYYANLQKKNSPRVFLVPFYMPSSMQWRARRLNTHFPFYRNLTWEAGQAGEAQHGWLQRGVRLCEAESFKETSTLGERLSKAASPNLAALAEESACSSISFQCCLLAW